MLELNNGPRWLLLPPPTPAPGEVKGLFIFTPEFARLGLLYGREEDGLAEYAFLDGRLKRP